MNRGFKIIFLLVVAMFLANETCLWAQDQRLRPDLPFKGKFLVVASDTDMLPSAYLDGTLGPDAGQDQLSIIRINDPKGMLSTAAIPVSNSVIGPPSSITLTPDEHYAIVVETRGPRTDHSAIATMGDLSTGRLITVVDLSDPAKPRVVQSVLGFDNPLSISISPAGDMVCVVSKVGGSRPHPTVAFYRFTNGRLSQPLTPEIPGAGPKDELVSAEFYPKENIIGLLYTEHPRLALFKVNESHDALSLTSWGDPINLDLNPFLVRFTRDGRYALVNAMLPGNLRGTVTSIRIAGQHTSDGVPRHEMTSRADAGILPEGMAISPDERWVVTTNLEHSTAALTSPDEGFFSSLTLMRFDTASGRLERVGDFPFDGRLSEAAVFDNSSQFLAVTCFAHYDPGKPGGSVDFWRLAIDPSDSKRAMLVKLNESVPVARGPQSMVIAR